VARYGDVGMVGKKIPFSTLWEGVEKGKQCATREHIVGGCKKM